MTRFCPRTGVPANRPLRRKRVAPVLYLLVHAALALTVLADATADPGSADPFEPSLTRREAELLQRVTAIAATNETGAVAMLRAGRTQESGPAVDFALGNLYFQLERYTEAEAAYRQAMEKIPRYRRAIMNLGRVLLLQDKTGETIELYRTLVRDGQANADILVLLGQALLMENHPVSAENAFRQSLLLDPLSGEARLGLARCLLDQERYRECAGLLDELLAQDFRRRDLWALRAGVFLALDRLGDARVALEAARRLGIANADMLADLGDLYLNAKQAEEAAACYNAALAKAAVSVPRLLRAVEGFLMAGAVDRAGELLERLNAMQERDPERFQPEQNAHRRRLQGQVAEAQGDTETAIEIYQALVRDEPLDAQALLRLGDLKRAQGRLEAAIMDFERAARVEGFEARALVRQAQVEVERERFDRAVSLLEAAQAFDEQTHVARYLEQVRRLAR